MHRFLQGIFDNVRKFSRLPSWLDWLLSVVEPLVVLAITFVVFYVGYYVVFGPTGNPHQVEFRELMKELHDNWRAGLILILLLFYRTARKFLEQAEEAFGVKKRSELPGKVVSAANPNRNQTI